MTDRRWTAVDLWAERDRRATVRCGRAQSATFWDPPRRPRAGERRWNRRGRSSLRNRARDRRRRPGAVHSRAERRPLRCCSPSSPRSPCSDASPSRMLYFRIWLPVPVPVLVPVLVLVLGGRWWWFLNSDGCCWLCGRLKCSQWRLASISDARWNWPVRDWDCRNQFLISNKKKCTIKIYCTIKHSNAMIILSRCCCLLVMMYRTINLVFFYKWKSVSIYELFGNEFIHELRYACSVQYIFLRNPNK